MHIWNAPWTFVKSLFLINRYGNLIGQTFVMLEETGYLSHGSRHVYLPAFLSHRSSSLAHQFCIVFRIFCQLFSIFSGESIRGEYVTPPLKVHFCQRNIVFVVMRTCAILGCRPRVTLMVNTLYIVYGLTIIVVSASLLLSHADGECDVLSREIILIDQNFLAVMQFEYLDEVGICIMPIPRMSSIFLTLLISSLDFV